MIYSINIVNIVKMICISPIKSTIHFGTYQLKDKETLLNALEIAYQNGYRNIDCAYHYKNQDIIGEFILNKSRYIPNFRSSIWITSKLSFRIMPKGEEAIRKSIEQTFTDLQTDYIDLMLIHAPEKNDILSWTILTEYRDKGRIRYIGVSNYNIEKLKHFISEITNPDDIYCNQIEFNPFLNRKELIELCFHHTIKVITYGNLYYTNDIIDSIANKLKVSTKQLLAKFSLNLGNNVILMATNPDFIKENINLNFEICQEDMELINNLHDTGNEYTRSKYKRFL